MPLFTATVCLDVSIVNGYPFVQPVTYFRHWTTIWKLVQWIKRTTKALLNRLFI